MRWSRFDYNILQSSEEELIRLSGVEVTSKLVFIGNYNYLYVQYCGDPSLPALILLHGYCGASMIFYKLLKSLSRKFYVIMIDLLGMGRSSRPGFYHTRLSECENFFVDCLESFRSREQLQRFSLAGHSFGGYVAGCYAIKYPQYPERLILISPIGVNEPPPGWDYSSYLEEKKDWRFRWAMKFVSFFWVQNTTPATILRKAGPFSHTLMSMYSYGKLRSLGEDREPIRNYLEQINLLPGSGELALIYILNPGGAAIKPLCKRLGCLKVPVLFFYGDRDWVKSVGGEQTASVNKKVIIKIIKNSGHDIYWDNPEKLLETLYESIEEADKFSKVN